MHKEGDFPIWYCPRFPVHNITFNKQPDEEFIPRVDAMEAHVREHGLINPLLILNHNRNQPRFWLKAGRHRFEIARRLEWTHVPAIVTGSCFPVSGERMTLDEINARIIKDGRLEYSGQGLRMTDNAHPYSYGTQDRRADD